MKPYTIRIFVKDGDPEGIRIADKMNWTGKGIAFPRTKLSEFRKLDLANKPGVYVLIGFSEEEESELPLLYIGEAEEVAIRLSNHASNKDFWDRAIVFVSEDNALNKAHVKWLEYKLIKRAQETGLSSLDNGAQSMEPKLSMHELADINSFFDEMLSIYPLLGLRAFDQPKAVVANRSNAKDTDKELNTVIVPAREEGFVREFLNNNCWYAIRIAGGKLDKIKYIAAYQSAPISAITHYAEVKSIVPHGDNGKYKLNFLKTAKAIDPIPIADAPSGTMQGPRYTNIKKLLAAKTVREAIC